MEVRADFVAVVHGLSSSHTTLDYAAEEKYTRTLRNESIDLIFEAEGACTETIRFHVRRQSVLFHLTEIMVLIVG